MREHLDTPKIVLVSLLLLAAFALVGNGDYAQELETENARLKAGAAHCKALGAELEADRIASHVVQTSRLHLPPKQARTPALRGSDLSAALPGGQP